MAQERDFEQPEERPADHARRSGSQPADFAGHRGRLRQLQDAHQELEERYRQLFNNANDIVYTIDMQGRFTSVNKAAERVTGYSAEEVIGRHYSVVVAPECLELTKEMVARKLAGGGPTTYEIDLLTKDGRRVPIELSSQIIVIKRQPVGIQGIARDITERRRADAQIKHQLERITALYDVAELLSRTLDEQALARDVVRACVDSFGVTLAWIARLESDGTLRSPASYPPEHRLPQQMVVQWNDSPAHRGVISRALATKMPVITQDLAADPGPSPRGRAVLAQGFRSVGGFPLVSRDRTLGVLVLYHTRPDFFNPERAEFFRACAHQATAALENARLYIEAETQLRQLQALRDIDMAISGSLDLPLTLRFLLEAVISQLKVDAAAILLYNDQTRALEYGAGQGFRSSALQHAPLRLGEGHAGRAALERRTVMIENVGEDPGDPGRAPLIRTEEFAAYVAVPLIAKEKIQGVLEIFQRTPISPAVIRAWRQVLDALTGRAAIAIDNAGLVKDLQRSNEDLALAYDTTLEGWARALDLRDRETGGHSQRVAEMTLRLARALAVPETAMADIRRGALIHDIGKIAISDAILLKPGPLTNDEWAAVRRHPVTAYELLSPIAFLRHALDIPYCHHEKWDGTGYPQGLRGEAIPLAARIFAVADVWDALRSDRPYRAAWADEQARAYILEQAGTQFDPRIVEVFRQLVPGD